MRIALVHNSSAGDGRPSRNELLRILREGGFEPDYRSIADEEWQKVLSDEPRPDAVVVAGGDGTIRKVVHETYNRGIPIAVIPIGTANNMARALGADPDPDCILSVLRANHTMRFDLGRIDGLSDESLFMEALGIGFLAETMQAVDRIKQDGRHPVREEKRAALEMLYLQVAESEAVELTLAIDGRDHSGSYILAEIMNTQCAGSNFLLAPGADPTDGALDVVLITEQERDQVLDHIQKLIDGEDARPPFTVYRARRVAMNWRGSALHVDDRLWPVSGDCPPGSRLDVTVDRTHVSFLVNANRYPERRGMDGGQLPPSR